MIICIPIDDDRGLDSPISAHFGSAPLYLITGTGDSDYRTVPNLNQVHQHGACTPLAVIEAEAIDGLVVGGIGGGALAKVTAAGIPVYHAEATTAGEALRALQAGRLPVMRPDMACAHGHAGH
jgi:predicted Fe-Mo cluster-binding NifX family protein